MIIDTQYLKNSKKLVVSYVDDFGDIKLKYYDWESPTSYQTCYENDRDKINGFRTWDNKPIKKTYVDRPDRYGIYEFIDNLPQTERDILFKYNVPNIYFIDIETEILDTFPDPLTANAQILTISIVYKDKVILMGLKDISREQEEGIIRKANEYTKDLGTEYKIKYLKFDTEFDLLYSFFNKMVPKMSVLTGWNFVEFDWKYLVNRSRKLKKVVDGKEYYIKPEVSSPTNRLETVFLSDGIELPKHRIVTDYMVLFKVIDTSIKVRESLSLDFVSDKLIGKQKIKFSGSFMDLYKDDFAEYLYYNTIDSILVQKIHEKMNYIEVLYAIANDSKIVFSDTISYHKKNLGTLAITEGVLRNRYKDKGIIIFKDRSKPKGVEEGIEGGYVKEPVTGMNRWVVVFDFASLYPNTQLEFYICPENFKGTIHKEGDTFCTNVYGEKLPIDEENDIICNNGCVFVKKESPFLEMLKSVYSERKVYKYGYQKNKEELANLKKEEALLLELIDEL